MTKKLLLMTVSLCLLVEPVLAFPLSLQPYEREAGYPSLSWSMKSIPSSSFSYENSPLILDEKASSLVNPFEAAKKVIEFMTRYFSSSSLKEAFSILQPDKLYQKNSLKSKKEKEETNPLPLKSFIEAVKEEHFYVENNTLIGNYTSNIKYRASEGAEDDIVYYAHLIGISTSGGQAPQSNEGPATLGYNNTQRNISPRIQSEIRPEEERERENPSSNVLSSFERIPEVQEEMKTTEKKIETRNSSADPKKEIELLVNPLKKGRRKPVTLEDLPKEIFTEILMYLAFNDLNNIAMIKPKFFLEVTPRLPMILSAQYVIKDKIHEVRFCNILFQKFPRSFLMILWMRAQVQHLKEKKKREEELSQKLANENLEETRKREEEPYQRVANEILTRMAYSVMPYKKNIPIHVRGTLEDFKEFNKKRTPTQKLLSFLFADKVPSEEMTEKERAEHIEEVFPRVSLTNLPFLSLALTPENIYLVSANIRRQWEKAVKDCFPYGEKIISLSLLTVEKLRQAFPDLSRIPLSHLPFIVEVGSLWYLSAHVQELSKDQFKQLTPYQKYHIFGIYYHH